MALMSARSPRVAARTTTSSCAPSPPGRSAAALTPALRARRGAGRAGAGRSHRAFPARAGGIELDPAGIVHGLDHQRVIDREVLALQILPELAVVHALEAVGHAPQ